MIAALGKGESVVITVHDVTGQTDVGQQSLDHFVGRGPGPAGLQTDGRLGGTGAGIGVEKGGLFPRRHFSPFGQDLGRGFARPMHMYGLQNR